MARTTRLTQQDLKIYPSQRLTDTDDGGGQMVGTPLTGADNELFNPVSDVDRTMGSFDARLVYPGVLRNDTEPLFGANFVISTPPKADYVSYLLFRANGYADARAQIMPRIEAYSVPTIESPMTLLGTQLKGSRLLQAYQRPEEAIPVVGQRYCVREGVRTQYVRVTDVQTVVRTFITREGKEFQRRVITMTLTDALVADFAGIDYPDIRYADPPAKLLETQVADTAQYYGCRPLAQPLTRGSATLNVDSIFEKLVPTSTIETAWADQYPVGASAWLPLEAARTVARVSGYHNGNLYLDCSVQPGTVQLGNYLDNAQGQLIDGGNVLAIDYAAGVIQNVTGYNLTVNAVPAARVNNADYTAIISVDETNQGTEWAPLLHPKPAPGATAVSFISGGQWYELKDHGDYQLRDINGKVVGTIERSGSVVVSLPALPDVNSKIICAWVPIDTFATIDDQDVGNTISLPPVEAQTRLMSDDLKNVQPSSVRLTWQDGGSNRSARDENGKIVGDITGTIDYATGHIVLQQAAASRYQVQAKTHIGSPQRKSVAISGADTDTVSGSFGAAVAAGSVIIELGATFSTETASSASWTENPTFFGNHIGFKEAGSTQNHSSIQRFVHSIVDDGNGGLLSSGSLLPGASINYRTGTFTIPTAALARDGRKVLYSDTQILNRATPISAPSVSRSKSAVLGGSAGSSHSVSYHARVESASMIAVAGDGGSRDVDTALINNQYTINVLQNKPWPSRVVLNSWVVLLDGQRLIERDGVFYRNIDPRTGNGVAVGKLDAQTGDMVLDGNNLANRQITIVSGLYRTDDFAQKQYYGRTPAAPIKPQSFTVYSMAGGTAKIGQAQADERITGDFSGSIDTETGFFMLEAAGFFMPESLRFNVVSQSYLPLDSSIIGIDAVRLPPDGRVPIYRKGDMIVISHKASHDLGSAHAAGTTVSLGRDDIDRALIVDVNGQAVTADQYTVDLDKGELTWASPLSLAAYQMPLTAHTVREEENRVVGADISGRLKLQFGVGRDYEADGTFVSSALIGGDLLVRASEPFTQQSWTKVWADERLSDAVLAKLNVKDYPIVMTSAGAITERWLIRFETSASQFRLYGERLGLVAESDILNDLAPINPATGKPYFRLPAAAFGGGWQQGYCIRFNTFGTPMPVWILRAVQPSPVRQSEKDGFVACLRGNTIDA